MSLPTTSVVHNRRRLNNKLGLYPVHLRITIDRKSKYVLIPVPAKITKAQWIGQDDNWVSADIREKTNNTKPDQVAENFQQEKINQGKLNFSSIEGHLFHQIFAFWKYNYDKNILEPVDISNNKF